MQSIGNSLDLALQFRDGPGTTPPRGQLYVHASILAEPEPERRALTPWA